MYVGVAQICYTKIHNTLVKNSFLQFYLISLFLDFLSSYGHMVARDLAEKEIVPELPKGQKARRDEEENLWFFMFFYRYFCTLPLLLPTCKVYSSLFVSSTSI